MAGKLEPMNAELLLELQRQQDFLDPEIREIGLKALERVLKEGKIDLNKRYEVRAKVGGQIRDEELKELYKPKPNLKAKSLNNIGADFVVMEAEPLVIAALYAKKGSKAFEMLMAAGARVDLTDHPMMADEGEQAFAVRDAMLGQEDWLKKNGGAEQAKVVPIVRPNEGR